MIRAEHIMHLKLDRERLLAHKRMPPPSYSTKELTHQITAIGDAIISNLLGVSPEVFQMQLDAARQFKVSYLLEDSNQNMMGVSTALSVIKSGEILQKNMILPRDVMWKDARLKNHYIIGAFIRGSVVDGVLPEVSEVDVAGWTDIHDIKKFRLEDLPPTFKSKLPVVMVPCSVLHPISTLAGQFNRAEKFV